MAVRLKFLYPGIVNSGGDVEISVPGIVNSGGEVEIAPEIVHLLALAVQHPITAAILGQYSEYNVYVQGRTEIVVRDNIIFIFQYIFQ